MIDLKAFGMLGSFLLDIKDFVTNQDVPWELAEYLMSL